MQKFTQKPYRIIGAYDSETTNYNQNGDITAFPILHQLGLLDGTPLEEINADNVEEHTHIELFRHALELYARLDELVSSHSSYVPIILCHNLAFDMYGLSPWLARHNVRVLAKSARKPITFTIKDENGKNALVIWDTLIFTQQSLERMGKDCGYKKGVGEWDYNLIRTPETPLTNAEIDYAQRDIYTLLAWFGWWIRRNPDIQPEKLGLNVVTKTGIVRERRKVRFDQLKGNGHKNNVGRYWLYRNRLETPKDDDELFTMLACTRGGFTFCAGSNASKPFNLDGTEYVIAGYDATSQHPAQLVSHRYPYSFHKADSHNLDLAFNLIGKISLERVLSMWDKPFPVAFNACFEFTNLRPKAGTIYERDNIFPIASARYKTQEQIKLDEDNGDRAAWDAERKNRDYADSVVNPTSAFGKLIAADKAQLYLTELSAWEVWQCYEWDSVQAIHGYLTGRFTRPSDMDVISTMQFYKAKNAFKVAREAYYDKGTIDNADDLKTLGIAPALVSEMANGSLPAGDVESMYLSLKADLNSIFGISCSNEFRRSCELGANGIEYIGGFGICNVPKNPKVWYQFGQRIVGWSRIAQICAIELLRPHVQSVINGDTDSIKVLVKKDDLLTCEKALQRLGSAIDSAKADVCKRVRYGYPAMFDSLDDIGHYMHEFTVTRFCASWNKAYCMQTEKGFSFTLAGIPTRRRESDFSCFIGLNGYADRLYKLGWTFEEICNLFLGYNVTFANDVIKLNARKFPQWAEQVFLNITDYQGNTARVVEPASLALYPMSKTINDTTSADNAVNSRYAHNNNPNVNLTRKVVFSKGVLDMEEGF